MNKSYGKRCGSLFAYYFGYLCCILARIARTAINARCELGLYFTHVLRHHAGAVLEPPLWEGL